MMKMIIITSNRSGKTVLSVIPYIYGISNCVILVAEVILPFDLGDLEEGVS